MPTLLHLDSSPLYGTSISRELSAAFVTQWKISQPEGRVLERDLNATVIAPITAEWVGSVFTPEEALAPQQKNFFRSPTLYLASWSKPMSMSSVYRCTILACLRYLSFGSIRSRASVRPSPTLMESQRACSWARGVTFIIATGGIYDAETQMRSFNFVEPYLRSVFGFLGVTDATFLTAGGTKALNYGQDRTAFLAPHVQAVQTHVQTRQGGHA